MIYFITGGERSGKSKYAQKVALQLSNNPVYLATAQRWDADFEKRIARHQAERNEQWVNIEEQKYISQTPVDDNVVVMDCVTLWLSNFFSECKGDPEQTLRYAQEEWELAMRKKCTWIVVSNEIGMGLHATSEAGRKFVEVQGWMNQYIAQQADEVIFMIAGIPLIVKSKIVK